MPTEIHLDRSKSLEAQPDKGHNRWHPDIPPVVSVPSGEQVILDTLDSRDGMITMESTDADVAAHNRNIGHPLTGPIQVEAAMTLGANRTIASLTAAVALAYLVAMVVTGALPENRQVVTFEAAGVLTQTPEMITRVKLDSKAGSYVFERRDSGWANAQGKRALDENASKLLDRALKIMHNSKPVRVLGHDDVAGTSPSEFGLEKPQLSVTMETADGVVLAVRFGNSNTDGILQYMSASGSDNVYLMSDFVGQGWEQVAAAQKQS